MLKKLNVITEALSYSGGWHALLTARPRSLTSWLIVNRLKTVGGDFHTIIDAGANAGQFARAAHLCYPEATILSFEPLADVADRLKSNLADVPTHGVFRTALGSYDGETEFFRNSYSQSSSVLPMLEKEGGLLEGTREVEKLRVPMARLDTALAGENLKPAILLKLDLQGNELEALRGAERTLVGCSHVLTETVFEQEYRGEPVFEDLWIFLRDRGFRFERPLNFSSDKSMGIVQMDALFSRGGAALG